MSPLAPLLTPSTLLTAQVTQLKQLFFSLSIAFILRLIQDILKDRYMQTDKETNRQTDRLTDGNV